MFYSHQLLARKGPLSTVWHAAHLQHKLNKSHYTSTNIRSTVEIIMNAQKAIALRMLGHLLLGLVHIHSKQVSYHCERCNELRIAINRIFTSASTINLPDDATRAPFQSMKMNSTIHILRSVDSHLKSHDDITLEGLIPTGQDPYIIFNEHDLRASSFIYDNSGSAPVPMEEDVQLGANDINVGNRSPQEPSSIEIMRGARHEDFKNSSPILPDRAQPDKVLEEQVVKDKDRQTSTPDARYSSPQNHEEQHSLGQFDSPMPFVHRSPVMELQPTPPPAAQPRVKSKRKWDFDESTVVLSNEHMKNALNDTNSICRQWKICPLSSLTIWKSNKRSKMRKEGVFYDPFITGSCADLHSMYEDKFISRRDADDIEIEFLRNNDFASPDRNMFDTVMPSPNNQNYLSPLNTNMRLQSERVESTEGGGTFHTADTGTSGNSEMETGGLGFLEQDDNSAAGSQGIPEFVVFSNNQETPELQRLSSRTRAVAQNLKRQASATPILGSSEEPSAHLSLNKILEGKRKKICARMFFETLVLKSYGLVDVHQEKPYDDITLKVSPKL